MSPGNAERSAKAYRAAMSKLAESTCAPFWWSIAKEAGTPARILNNGTISYVDTGTRKIGVSASHVYQRYLGHVAQNGSPAIECQFGGSTIYPEQVLIDQSAEWDIVTFAIPEVFVGASARNPKTHHCAQKWPPERVRQSDVVLYGGGPGTLREERGSVADFPFQWVVGRVGDVAQNNVVVEPDFATMQWQGGETNDNPGGWSGGPVFRVVEDTAIARLELIAFISEFVSEQAVLARHGDVVLSDGRLQ